MELLGGGDGGRVEVLVVKGPVFDQAKDRT